MRMPSLIRKGSTPRKLSEALSVFLDDNTLWNATRSKLLALRLSLGEGGSARAAEAVLQELTLSAGGTAA